MIFIADTPYLSDIAKRLTIGGSDYSLALARLNNLPSIATVPVGTPLSIPDSWLSETGKRELTAKGYVVGGGSNVTASNTGGAGASAGGSGQIFDAGVTPEVLVTAKRDYTLYIVAAVVIGLLLATASKKRREIL